MPSPGERIKLSKETSDQLAKELCELTNQFEDDHREELDKQAKLWDWYNAKPATSSRTEPWPGASNVVVPQIQTASDAITSRLWGRMHTPQRTWTVGTENETYEKMTSSLGEFMNSESRSTFDIMTPTYDWVNEMVVTGQSVLQVGWKEKHAFRFTGGARKPRRVLVSRGPFLRHVPRELILWERDRLIEESSVVIRADLMSWNELVGAVHTDDWDAQVVEDAKNAEGVEGPAGMVLNRHREQEGRATDGYHEPHDIREVWIEWSMAQLLTRRTGGVMAPEFDKSLDERIPIVVTLHRRTQRILRVVAHPYFFWRWPFLDAYFRRQPGRASSRGVAEILEQPQRAVTTMVNQSIDAVTMSNTLKLATQNPRMKNQQFKPFQYLFVDNLADIQPLNLGAQVVPDLALINFMTATGERVTGIADPNLGRETRLGGHPSPATNTLVQLQEGSKVLNTTLRLLRMQLSTAGEWILALYQQNDLGEGSRLADKLGPEDAARLQEVAVAPPDVKFDLHSLSESVNPDAERNSAVVVSQMTSEYYAFVLRMLQVAENPQLPPSFKEAAGRAIDAKTRSYVRFLEASDVDDADAFALQLQESRANDAASVQQFGAEAQQRLQQAGGAPQGVPGNGVAEAIGGAEPPEGSAFGAAGSGFVL